MKLRFDGGESKRLILNQQQDFRTDAGWDESFQTFEDEVLKDIINPIENYETIRYIHKPYTSSNNIYQTDIWFYFYFVSGGTYVLDYTPQGLDQTSKLLANVKNSFFRLEFYKTPNNEPPNRSNRRLVFAKNLSLPVGQKAYIDSIKSQMYVPVFMGSNYKNKENMYLFWFEDDTVLEESTLTGTTFFMTAKFYNAVDGSRLQFANKEISNSSSLVEEDDLYFEVQMDRSNQPSFHYDITEYNSSNTVRGNRIGTSSSPVKFYEIGGNGTTSGPTPTPTATPTPTPTTGGGNCNFDVDVVTGSTSSPTPTPTPTSSISWSNGTTNTHSNTLPGDNPSTGTTTGTVTVTNGPVTVYINVSKAFNYANTAVGDLTISGVGSISIPVLPGDSSATSTTLTIPVGIYPYTIKSILTIDGGLTSGQMTTTVNQQ